RRLIEANFTCPERAAREFLPHSRHDPLKTKYTPIVTARKIALHKHEDAPDYAWDLAKTDAYVTSGYARKKVEMFFAHLERIMRPDRLRRRGPNDAKNEFLLAATAQKLRKLVKLVPMAAGVA
ncbi:hypothetical protein OU682_21820, partial [Paracoccus sp. EF6]|nr:hypothetical protein [Paracoccus sp. EF6]